MFTEEEKELVEAYKPVKKMLDKLRKKYGDKVSRVEYHSVLTMIDDKPVLVYPLGIKVGDSRYLDVE